MKLKPFSGTLFINAELDSGFVCLDLEIEVTPEGDWVKVNWLGKEFPLDLLERLSGEYWDEWHKIVGEKIPEALQKADEDAQGEYADYMHGMRQDDE